MKPFLPFLILAAALSLPASGSTSSLETMSASAPQWWSEEGFCYTRCVSKEDEGGRGRRHCRRVCYRPGWGWWYASPRREVADPHQIPKSQTHQQIPRRNL